MLTGMSNAHRARPARRPEEPGTAGHPRTKILQATIELLRHRRFDGLSVADILAGAGVSRASFYFYFPSKQAVLGVLVRDAVAQGQQAAQPWLGEQGEPADALRAGVTEGARLWRENAGVLMAIVENFGSDDDLRALWLEQMELFTAAATARILADARAREHLRDLDAHAVAASLTWLGERLYYLAAAGVPPYDDEDTLTDTLTNAWTSTLYGEAAPAVRPPKKAARRR